MTYRILLIGVMLLMASCTEQSPAAPSAPNSAPSIPASALKYSTRVGTFRVQLPDNYISVRNVDPAFFAVFQQRMPKLEIVDVFLTREDLERSKTPDQLMQDQLVQLQIFPGDAPPVTDEMWGPLREQLPAMMSGAVGRSHIHKGIEQAKALPQQPGSELQIKDLAVGDIVIYSNTDESVRWATSASLEMQSGSVPARTVLASAARRVGDNVYLVQTAVQVSSEQETLQAVRSLDDWLTRVWASLE